MSRDWPVGNDHAFLHQIPNEKTSEKSIIVPVWVGAERRQESNPGPPAPHVAPLRATASPRDPNRVDKIALRPDPDSDFLSL
jgi:hypothetical protein